MTTTARCMTTATNRPHRRLPHRRRLQPSLCPRANSPMRCPQNQVLRPNPAVLRPEAAANGEWRLILLLESVRGPHRGIFLGSERIKGERNDATQKVGTRWHHVSTDDGRDRRAGAMGD